MLKFSSYVFRDREEVFWKLSHEKAGDIEGWYVYAMKPGELKFFCKGMTTLEDVEKRIGFQPPKLDEDDIINLGMWMKTAGIYQWTEDFRIVKETNG